MAAKSFEEVVPFLALQPDPTNPGLTIHLPIVTVGLLTAAGVKVDLPLMFDTGASVTTLRADLFPLLGLTAWNVGQQVGVNTASGANVPAYRYQVMLEIFGKTLAGPVQLMELPANPFYVGLLGRESFFEAFGFGFWESTHELHATVTP